VAAARGSRAGRPIENVLPKAADMLARVRAEAGDQVRGDAVPVLDHGCQNSDYISNVGQHGRVGDEVGILELLLLLNRITALDRWPAEGDPIDEVA
jgi:hypothetical protein